MTKDKKDIYELFLNLTGDPGEAVRRANSYYRLREKLKYLLKSEESRHKSDLANELRCPYCHHENIATKRLGDPCVCYNCGHLIF